MQKAQGYLLMCVLWILAGCGEPADAYRAEVRPLEKRLHTPLPQGWQLRYDGDGIRWGSLVNNPTGAAVAITRFPGSLGTELENINRWRGQLGLEPVTEAALTPLEGAGLAWRWVWLENKSDILAAATVPLEGTTLTFRLTAKKAQVDAAQLKSDFMNILREASWK